MKRHDYHWCLHGLICLLCILVFGRPLSAQVEAPQTKGVYGGDVSFITAISNGAAQTRLYLATESANSAFYGDIDLTQPDPFGTNLMFHVIPDMRASANHGAPNDMAFHQPSGRIFFTDAQDGILSCTTASNSITTNLSISAWALAIEESSLVAVQWDYGTINFLFGTLSADGLTFTQSSGSPIQIITGLAGMWNVSLAVHPTNHQVYINWQGTNLVRSSDAIENLSGTTTFTPLVLPALTTNWHGAFNDYWPFGFGPDGRIFVGGYNSANTNSVHNCGREITYSDDNGATWSSVIDGGSGSLLWSTVGDALAYSVYNGSSVSTNKGVNWSAFGTQVPGSRVGSGRVVPDPSRVGILYCDTEGGLGVCTNGGSDDTLETIRDISRGIEAATINDFDITADNTIAWIAANGIRRAVDFQGAPEWSEPKWPLGDGTCNYVAVDKSDTNGLTVYAGGTFLYKTTNGGALDTNVYNATNWTCVFNPTNYGFGGDAVSVSAIEASSNIVAVGLQSIISCTNKGALFLSADAGSNWNQIVLDAGGVDIKDLLLTRENGDQVVYAAVANNYITTAYGVFKIRIADAAVTHELTDAVNMQDLAAASDGGLYASGFDAQTNVVLYSKAASASAWTRISLNGYSTNLMISYGGKPVITVGRDALSNEVPYLLGKEWIFGTNASETRCAIYYMTTEGTNATWQTSDALRYPMGTRINVIYWDDLVVGTDIGLYGQMFQSELTVTTTALAADFDGDSLADPAVFNTNGNWKIKLSTANYTLIPLSGFLGGSGATALAADFDGDRLADPAVYYAALELWAVKLSSINYLAPTVLTSFGGTGWQAIASDFDGDSLADPALYNTNGTWKVKLSTANYTTITSADLLGYAGWTAIAADFDGDGKADPTIYRASTGSWIVLMSKVNYAIAVIEPGFLGNTGYIGLAADFDGDAYADPTVAQTSTGNWKLKLSSGNYSLLELNGFLGE